MAIFTTIPAGQRALVSNLWGTAETIVDGPNRVLGFKTVRFFKRTMLEPGNEGTLFDPEGNPQIMVGPCAFHVHPDGDFRQHQVVRVAANEAVVLIRATGERVVVYGQRETEDVENEAVNEASTMVSSRPFIVAPLFFLRPGESLHEFALTGGGSPDGLDKRPRDLRLTHIRLTPSQTYLAVRVRTRQDHTALIIKLMIFFRINHLRLFLESSDDPFGAMFNLAISKATSLVSAMTFEQFKESCADLPARLSDVLMKTNLERYGIELDSVILRGWDPEDASIASQLARATTVAMQVETAGQEHALAITRLRHQEAQMAAEGKLLEMKAAQDYEQKVALGRGLAAMASAAVDAAAHAGHPEMVQALLPRLLTLSVAGAAVTSGKQAGQLSIPNTILDLP